MKPILIAECCQNHQGKREVLKRMVHSAAEHGADYVKLQTIRSSELTHRVRFDEGASEPDGTTRVIKRPFRPELERLAGLDLSLDDEAWFIDECRSAGVASVTTVFTRGCAREVKDLGYDAIKIASYDCASFPLLRDVRQWWSTLFVSTGATFDSEIERAASILAGTNYSFLHCVTLYPTPMDQLHLRRMAWLRRFTPRVGYSDHTKPGTDGLWATKIALALGANCVERHFTILGPGETKDGPVSVTASMLRELRQFADRPRVERMAIVKQEYPAWETTLGAMRRALSPAELRNRDYYRGRFATKRAGTDIYNWEDAELDDTPS